MKSFAVPAKGLYRSLTLRRLLKPGYRVRLKKSLALRKKTLDFYNVPAYIAIVHVADGFRPVVPPKRAADEIQQTAKEINTNIRTLA